LQLRAKTKNKAGMFMIANDFYFWSRPKAGMYMKKSKLSNESWNVVDAQWDSPIRGIQFSIISMKIIALTDSVGNVTDKPRDIVGRPRRCHYTNEKNDVNEFLDGMSLIHRGLEEIRGAGCGWRR
jgi:hypothetical protein